MNRTTLAIALGMSLLFNVGFLVGWLAPPATVPAPTTSALTPTAPAALSAPAAPQVTAPAAPEVVLPAATETPVARSPITPVPPAVLASSSATLASADAQSVSSALFGGIILDDGQRRRRNQLNAVEPSARDQHLNAFRRQQELALAIDGDDGDGARAALGRISTMEQARTARSHQLLLNTLLVLTPDQRRLVAQRLSTWDYRAPRWKSLRDRFDRDHDGALDAGERATAIAELTAESPVR